jgi:hypothetical protein
VKNGIRKNERKKISQLTSSQCHSWANLLARVDFPTPGLPKRMKHVGLE